MKSMRIVLSGTISRSFSAVTALALVMATVVVLSGRGLASERVIFNFTGNDGSVPMI
jgi:hypothetical protein